MAIRFPVIVFAIVALAACATESPVPADTAAQLPTTAATGSGQVTVTCTEFWRDYSPTLGESLFKQLRRLLGRDVGTALGGAANVLVENTNAVRATFTIQAIVYDVHGNVYPAEVGTIYDEGIGQEWNGTIAAHAQHQLVIYFQTSGYPPVGTNVYAQLTWTDQQGQTTVVRTEVTPIIATS